MTITSFIQVTAVSTANVGHEKQKSLLWSYRKVLYVGPKSARNSLTNLNPNPARKARPDSQLCSWVSTNLKCQLIWRYLLH